GYKKILPCLQNFLVPCVGKTTPRSQARGNVERGSRIEAASSVSGASVTLDTTSAVGTPHRSATLPHSSEPATIAPKNTIWCTAMPRARMKLGRIIWTAVPLLAMTVIQQAPETVRQRPNTTGVMVSAAINVAMAWMVMAQMLARSAPTRRLMVGIEMAPATAPTPNTG